MLGCRRWACWSQWSSWMVVHPAVPMGPGSHTCGTRRSLDAWRIYWCPAWLFFGFKNIQNVNPKLFFDISWVFHSTPLHLPPSRMYPRVWMWYICYVFQQGLLKHTKATSCTMREILQTSSTSVTFSANSWVAENSPNCLYKTISLCFLAVSAYSQAVAFFQGL